MSTTQPQSSIGQPAWEIAYLFPDQGMWYEAEYLALDTNRLVEFVDGRIEVLPMPTELHQRILAFLYRSMFNFVEQQKLGIVLFAGLRVKLWEGRIREPDIVYMSRENEHCRGNKFWTGADLAIEVVSEDDPNRDLVTKREEYAKAGIREYWIVDPRDKTIAVLQLTETDKPYSVAGNYQRGEQAKSILLSGLTVNVDDVFSADQ